jgi:hypothetical protein
MLADPHSKQIPTDKNNYTEDEFQAALALLADDSNKRKQPEYWSDSDNDDWPKYDDDNEHPYDPTAEVPAEKRKVINLQQTANKTNKQQPPSKRSRPSGNVPATNMQRLDYAIASRKYKPRGVSLGGRKTKRRTKHLAKRTTKRRTKRLAKRTTKRTTKRLAKAGCYTNRTKRLAKAGCYTNRTKRKKGGSGKEKIPITKDGLHFLPGTGKPNDHIVEVEDPTAQQGHIDNMAKVRGTGPPPVYNPKTGLFE